MSGFVYILECADGSYYVGSTTDLSRRIQEHKDGMGGEYTRKRLPIRLVYAEEFPTIAEAYQREKQLQGWGRKKRKALIEGRLEDLKVLAKKKFKDK